MKALIQLGVRKQGRVVGQEGPHVSMARHDVDVPADFRQQQLAAAVTVAELKRALEAAGATSHETDTVEFMVDFDVEVVEWHDLMAREHAAWLDVGQEFRARGIDINEGGWSQLIYAVRKWGEELVQLRIGDPSHTETALREAREAYEGQYERGTYPEAID